jgi:putative ABC transport system ATP-binding protein
MSSQPSQAVKPMIEIKGLTKTYLMGQNAVHALRGIDLTIYAGEFVAIMGFSGSGKSTLMNLLGCLDAATFGEYFLDGKSVSNLNRYESAAIRNKMIGFVFQGFNLLPRTSALENVMLPLVYDRSSRVKNAKKMAIEALERVKLADRMDHEPNQLSGGQQQRVAIARAVVDRPSIILADEPTGNLDTETSVEIMALFQQLNREGITMILVTHEPELANYASRIVCLRDGLILYDEQVKNRRDAAQDLANYKSESSAKTDAANRLPGMVLKS